MAARYPDLIDTHAHVSDSEFDRDRESVIERAAQAGIGFIEIGFDVDSSAKAVALARGPALAAAVGIHPHNAADCASSLPAAWTEIESLAREPKVVAIGEIGLDYYRDLSPRNVQVRCFEMGLDMAGSLGLPVVIHQRDARQDTIDMLRHFKIDRPIVFHCFGGDLSYARDCLDLGGYLGLGGVVTYPKNAEIRDLLRFIPTDRILLETDAPYLSPQSRRGRRNEPVYMLETLEAVAAALEADPSLLGRIARDNAIAAFRL